MVKSLKFANNAKALVYIGKVYEKAEAVIIVNDSQRSKKINEMSKDV
jgi:hypothetical protein